MQTSACSSPARASGSAGGDAASASSIQSPYWPGAVAARDSVARGLIPATVELAAGLPQGVVDRREPAVSAQQSGVEVAERLRRRDQQVLEQLLDVRSAASDPVRLAHVLRAAARRDPPLAAAEVAELGQVDVQPLAARGPQRAVASEPLERLVQAAERPDRHVALAGVAMARRVREVVWMVGVAVSPEALAAAALPVAVHAGGAPQ